MLRELCWGKQRQTKCVGEEEEEEVELGGIGALVRA